MCKEGQSLLIDRGKGNVGKVLREQHLVDIFRFLGEMGIPGTRGGFPELSGWRKSGAWCSATKKQGIAGSEAPRQLLRRLDQGQWRGAPRRRNKGLRAVRHHAIRFRTPIRPSDVVPGDEEIRVCGWRSTTPSGPVLRFAHPTWCPATKKQGLAGGGAPRRPRQRPDHVLLAPLQA